jgi:hypothetical protein
MRFPVFGPGFCAFIFVQLRALAHPDQYHDDKQRNGLKDNAIAHDPV